MEKCSPAVPSPAAREKVYPDLATRANLRQANKDMPRELLDALYVQPGVFVLEAAWRHGCGILTF
jgi:hypothetical protein